MSRRGGDGTKPMVGTVVAAISAPSADSLPMPKGRRRVNTTPGMKHCGQCDKVKPVREFHRNRARCDGLAAQCIACRTSIDRERNLSPSAKREREQSRNEHRVRSQPTGWWASLSDHERADWLREAARSV